MTIDSLTAPAGANASTASSRAKIKSDFQALAADLQNGNLANAQTDFSTLMQDAPQLQNQIQATSSTPAISALGASAPAASAPASSALASLSAALQSGDLAGAQAAMTSLQQSVQGHHHHHHHHHADNDQDDASQAAGAVGSTTAGSAAPAAPAPAATSSVTA